jgi:hypothetical protein
LEVPHRGGNARIGGIGKKEKWKFGREWTARCAEIAFYFTRFVGPTSAALVEFQGILCYLDGEYI